MFDFSNGQQSQSLIFSRTHSISLLYRLQNQSAINTLSDAFKHHHQKGRNLQLDEILLAISSLLVSIADCSNFSMEKTFLSIPPLKQLYKGSQWYNLLCSLRTNLFFQSKTDYPVSDGLRHKIPRTLLHTGIEAIFCILAL